MKRQRIVDTRRHAACFELHLQCVAFIPLDYVQMVDVRRPGSNEGHSDTRSRELRGIPRRSAPPIGIPLIKVSKLYPQNCRLQRVEPTVEADLRVAVFGC